MNNTLLSLAVAFVAVSSWGDGNPYHVRFKIPDVKDKTAVNLFARSTTDRNRLSVRGLSLNNSGNSFTPRNVAHVTPEGVGLYGYMGYSDLETFKAGLYSLTDDGYELKWDDPLYTEAGLSFNTGWLRDGKVCGLMPFHYMGELLSVLYVSYDLATGMPVDFIDQDIKEGVFEIAAYDPDDDMIYGYGFDTKGDWKFMRAPADDPFSYSVVKDISKSQETEICSALTYNCKDKMLYGVNASNKLVRISLNGTQTEVMQLSRYALDYISGFCYSEQDDLFYWNATLKEPGSLSDVSYLYSIDPVGKVAKELYEYENTEEFMFFFTDGDKPVSEAPEAPVITNVDFKGVSRSGDVCFTMPSLTEAGESLGDSPVEWVMMIDGSVYKSSEANAGSQVEVSVDDQKDGLHQLTVFTKYDGITGRSSSKTYFVGVDVPAAPKHVVLTKNTVKWDAVVLGVNGGYVDTSALIYKVYINNVFETTTSATSCEITISENQPLRAYRAHVVAEAGGLCSEPGYSNTLVEGQAMKLPVTITPTADQVALCSVTDSNDDGYGWSFNDNEGCFQSDYSENGSMDDWFFLPAMDFNDADRLYRLSFEASLGSAKYHDEFLEVRFGSSSDPDAMTSVIMPKFSPASEVMEGYVAGFNVPAAMKGYIGFHAISDPDQYGLKVRNIIVEQTSVTSSSPSAVTDLTAECVRSLNPSAKVSFRMPSVTVGGERIDAATSLKAVVSSTVKSVELVAKPGETVSTTISASEGWNTIKVVVCDDAAEGPENMVRVYCGLDVPAPVKSLISVEYPDMMKLSLSWTAPDSGFNGGVIDPKGVSYEIYKLAPTLMGYNWQLIDKVNDTEYTYVCEPGAPQEIVQLGVLPVNDKGDCARIASVSSVLGAPLVLPFVENFDGPYGPVNDPWLIYKPDGSYTASWGFGDFKEFLGMNDGRGIIGDTDKAGAKGRLGIPRISTKGMKKVDVAFNIYCGDLAAQTSILGECFGMNQPVVLKKAERSGGFVDLQFELPSELLDKDWVQLYIDALFENKDSFVAISSIRLDGESSGVSEIEAEGYRVDVEGEAICIRSNRAASASVVSVGSGLSSKYKLNEGLTRIPVLPGVYVVTVDGHAFKVIVK